MWLTYRKLTNCYLLDLRKVPHDRHVQAVLVRSTETSVQEVAVRCKKYRIVINIVIIDKTQLANY